jgi:hypothetical protein
LHCRGFVTRREIEREYGIAYERLAELAAIPYWRPGAA